MYVKNKSSKSIEYLYKDMFYVKNSYNYNDRYDNSDEAFPCLMLIIIIQMKTDRLKKPLLKLQAIHIDQDVN